MDNPLFSILLDMVPYIRFFPFFVPHDVEKENFPGRDFRYETGLKKLLGLLHRNDVGNDNEDQYENAHKLQEEPEDLLAPGVIEPNIEHDRLVP